MTEYVYETYVRRTDGFVAALCNLYFIINWNYIEKFSFTLLQSEDAPYTLQPPDLP